MIWIILGIVGIFAGVIVMILGHMWALAVMGLGFVSMVVGSVRMLRVGGYSPEGVFFNGLGGQGRQQSEAVKQEVPGSGEQPANIWEMVEDK